MSGEDPGLSEVFDALVDEQRRRLLVALMDRNPRSAAQLPPQEGIAPAEQQRRHAKLQHPHLPKLVDYGFVDWDRSIDEVTKGPRFDELRPVLEALREGEDV